MTTSRFEGGDPFPDEPYWLTKFVSRGEAEQVIYFAVPGHGSISLRELCMLAVDRNEMIQGEQQGA